jgi:hypothetical protein
VSAVVWSSSRRGSAQCFIRSRADAGITSVSAVIE